MSVTPTDAVDFYLYEAPVHERIMELRNQINTHLAENAIGPARAHVLVDRDVPFDPSVLVRGDPSRHGPRVPRHRGRRSGHPQHRAP